VPEITELTKAFVILLAVIDPVGNLPLYISLTYDKTEDEHNAIILKTACASAVLLIVSFFFGKYIIAFFGIRMPAFKLVGGIFLLYIAFTMLADNKAANSLFGEHSASEDLALMPLTFPLFIGPAAISFVIIQSSELTEWPGKALSVAEFILIGAVLWASLKFARKVVRLLGKTGIKFVTQIMGLLLGSLAVGIMADELKELLPGLS